MNTFYASGEGYDELVNNDGKVIGFCPLKRPNFTIEAETLEDALNAPISHWSLESDNGGNFEFYDGYSGLDDFYNGDQIITEIYYDTIEEF